jgi:hypothetical protein
LARELLEECGVSLLGVDGELGAIIEYDHDTEAGYDVFMMTSHYYFCRVGADFGPQNLEGYERDLGFKPVWIDIDKAAAENRSLLSTRTPPEWLRREIFVLEYLKQMI